MIENFETIVTSSIFTRLGWTMLHSFWLLAILGTGILLVLSRMRSSSANLRYSFGYLGLCMMMVTPIIVFCFVGNPVPSDSNLMAGNQAVAANSSMAIKSANESLIDESTLGDPSETSVAESVQPALQTEHTSQAMSANLFDWVAPWLSLVWLGGIACLSFWHLGGWWTACRMCKIGTSMVTPDLEKTIREVQSAMEIKTTITVKKSAVAAVPVVIGWLKPTVLIPIHLMEQLSGVQLRMVIAHELAHVRRHDYLANLMQTTIDTLLFFHPFAWWVSKQVRVERENCCDDLAVDRCGEGVDLASAIVAIESARSEEVSSSVVAATGGDTRARVYRLLGQTKKAKPRRYRPLPILSMAAIVVLTLFFVNDIKPAVADDKKPEWGPIQNGLQMRLTVENRTGADENIHKVTIEIANRRDKPIQFQIPWDSLGGEDWTGFVRANTAFKCNPQTPDESFQTAAGFETGPKFLPSIQPGESIKVSWIESANTLGHAQGYPRFNRSGTYDVTAAINLLPKDAKEEIMLTSNSQTYVMGGSDEKPLKGICRLSKVSLKSMTAKIDVGSNDLLQIGDRFSKHELGSHWKFTIVEIQPNSSTVKFEAVVGEPRNNVIVPLDLERLEIKHNRKQRNGVTSMMAWHWAFAT